MWSFLGIALSAALTVVSLRAALVSSRAGERQIRSAEMFRRLQWSVELALDPSPARSETGMAALDGLLLSRLLGADDLGYVRGIMAAVVQHVDRRPEGS